MGANMNRVEYSDDAIDAIRRERERREIAPELLAMLKELEWVMDDGFYVCVICQNWKDNGHLPDCRLSALLKTAEG
jgi:hypothetical protein